MTTSRGYHLMRQEIAGSDGLMQHIGRKVASVRSLWHGGAGRQTAFQSSAYWQERYRQGSNSGPGSYGRLALFKAEIVNRFVRDHNIADIIEFGSGDGAQLTLADYPRYVGVDVSPARWRCAAGCLPAIPARPSWRRAARRVMPQGRTWRCRWTSSITWWRTMFTRPI